MDFAKYPNLYVNENGKRKTIKSIDWRLRVFEKRDYKISEEIIMPDGIKLKVKSTTKKSIVFVKDN